MPLIGYMKTSDPGRVSSITNLEGNKQRRKKIEPIAVFSNSMYMTMYVVDCLSHEPPGSVVPVLLRRYVNGQGWEDIGVAKCCPICWTVIQSPVEEDLPAALPLLVEKKTGRDGGSRVRVKKLKPRTEKTSSVTFAQSAKIMGLVEKTGSTTVQDVMELLDLSRATCLKLLSWLVKQGKLVKQQSVGGRGARSIYEKAP